MYEFSDGTCKSQPAPLCSPQWWISLSSVQWTFCRIWHSMFHLEHYEWTFSVRRERDKHKHIGNKYKEFNQTFSVHIIIEL